MPKPEKIKAVEELRGDIEGSVAMIVTDYRGLTVSDITALRRKLRETGAQYKVVKNTLFELAAKDKSVSGMEAMLAGPTAIAFASSDAIGAAKAIVDFMKDHKAMTLKGGMVDGQVYGEDGIKALSKVPPREVLISQMLGAVQAPLTNLVGTLQGVMSGLVYTLQAVADQKAA